MNDIKTILTPDFFDTYYVQSKMNYKQITNMLHQQGCHMSLSSVKKYGRRFDVGRSRSECKRSLDWDVSFFSEEISEIVDGLILSDASITPKGQIAATLQYQEFRDYCSSLLKSYQPANLICYPNSNKTPYFRFCTKMHPDFQQQRDRWYPDGIKKIPRDIRITSQSVLLWYLGDGYIDPRWGNIFLYTNSFDTADVKRAVKLLNQVNVRCKFYWARSQGSYKKDYPVIYISSKNAPSFFEFVGVKSPVKCYDYKFNVPDWFPGAMRISYLSEVYNLPTFKVRWVVSKLEASNSPYIKRRKPKGRIWILKDGVQEVLGQCN